MTTDHWFHHYQCALARGQSMSDFKISDLAIPAVLVLISFLSYSSQYLFLYIEPAPLNKRELLWFNGFVACSWICYYRACRTNPGFVPKELDELSPPSNEEKGDVSQESSVRRRWCRKCNAAKPPRAHHCKSCQRYEPAPSARHVLR